jgi:hypothetical protein
MGIAVIQRPLKLIEARTYAVAADAVDTHRTESLLTKMARRAAQRGNGARVHEIARAVL